MLGGSHGGKHGGSPKGFDVLHAPSPNEILSKQEYKPFTDPTEILKTCRKTIKPLVRVVMLMTPHRALSLPFSLFSLSRCSKQPRTYNKGPGARMGNSKVDDTRKRGETQPPSGLVGGTSARSSSSRHHVLRESRNRRTNAHLFSSLTHAWGTKASRRT